MHKKIASLAASLTAMYSTFVIEAEMVGFLELFQDTTPLFKMNKNPDVDLLSSRSN